MKINFLRQSTTERRSLILNGSIPVTLITLSVPTLFLSLVQSLTPLIDGLFINNTSGILVASAVTFCSPILNMMTSLAQGLSVAAMALIGQLNGRGAIQESRRMTIQIVVIGSVLGLFIAPIMVLIARIVSGQLVPDLAPYVFTYLSLYALVLPFSFLESIYNGIKNANGQPEAPFFRMIIMLILKIIFNTVFLFYFRLGILGCILASLLSNIIITVWMYYELFVQKSEDKLELKGFAFEPALLKQIFSLGIPAILNSVLLNVGFYLINMEIEKYGPVVLNGQGIAGNITTVCFNLPSAFTAAVTTMVGMYIGAGYKEKAKRTVFLGCILSAVTAVLIIAIIVPLSSSLTVFFTRDEAVLEIANRSLHIYTYSVIGFGVCMVIQGAFIGLGKTKIPLILGILRVWLLRYVFILLTSRYLSFYSVFWGNLFSNYMAAIIAIILLFFTKWESGINKIKKEVSHV